jgi:uncharacterized membrane protein YbhN (UPF0104 family)
VAIKEKAGVVKRRIWAWIRPLAAIAILALLVWRLGTGAFVHGLRVIDGGTLLLGVAIGAVATVASAWRWCLVARGLGIRLPLHTATADYYRALFLNAALPGGVLGDVHRAVANGKQAGDVGRGVRAVVLERTAGQIVLAVVSVLVFVTLPSPAVPHGVVVALAAVTGGLAVAGGVVAWWRPWRGGSRWARGGRLFAGEIRDGLLDRRVWPGVFLASGVALAGHLLTFLVAVRAAGSDASPARIVPLMILALLAMGLPLNVGGWGPREGVCAWAFAAAGLGATLGLTVAVVYGVLTFAASLPGAAVLLTRWALRLRLRVDRPRRVLPTPARVPVYPQGGAIHG